jgi:arylformamidase
VQAAGKPVTYIVGAGYNHFEFPETLANPYGYLGRVAPEMMGLQANRGKK